MVHINIQEQLFVACNPTRLLLILLICYILSREKHGLVRNDFLDSMIELRKAGKDEALGDVKSEKGANCGEGISK
jgi:hypothetical protein